MTVTLQHANRPPTWTAAPAATVPAQVIPSTAIGFTIYDYCKSSLGLPTNL